MWSGWVPGGMCAIRYPAESDSKMVMPHWVWKAAIQHTATGRVCAYVKLLRKCGEVGVGRVSRTYVGETGQTVQACVACGSVLPVSGEFFYRHASYRSGFLSRCIPCEKAYQREMRPRYRESSSNRSIRWQQNNPERQKMNQRVARRRVLDYISSVKMERGCCICGYAEHPVALDFHHRGSDKVFTIGAFLRGRRDLNRLVTELAKCDVLCSNCHRVLHFGSPVGGPSDESITN